MYFDQEIILFNQSVADQDSALKLIASEFLKKKLVTDYFVKAILDREKNYPTGLDVNGSGVAIPHTDSDKVIVPQLGFMSLARPVVFREMGSNSGKVEVDMIFMLGLKSADDQLGMLQKLVTLFQNESLVKQLKSCRQKRLFIEIMKKSGIN